LSPEEHETSDPAVLASIFVALLLWGSAYPAMRVALDFYTPGELAALRFTVTSLLLAGWVAARPEKIFKRRQFGPIAAAGLFGIAAYHVLLNMGVRTVAAGPASFIVSLCPIFVALLAGHFLKEKLPFRGWLAVFVCLSGVALISVSKSRSGPAATGALLIFAGTFCQACHHVIQKRLAAEIPPIALTTYVVWAGTFFLTPFLPGAIIAFFEAGVAARDPSLAALYLGIGPGLLAYGLWSFALQRMSVSRAGAYLFLKPLFSIAIAWIWLGQLMSSADLLGGALVMTGMLLFTFSGTLEIPVIRFRFGRPSSVP